MTKFGSPCEALIATEGTHRYQTSLEAGMGIGLFGFSATAWIMPLLLDERIALTTGLAKPQLVLCSVAIYAAWAAGCGILSPAGDRVGRKPVLIGSSLLGAAGFALTACVAHVPVLARLPVLLISRMANGFAVGGIMSQAFALAMESSESARGKKVGVTLNVYFCAGVCLVAALHWIAMTLALPWQVELLCTSLWLTIASVATSRWVAESPTLLFANAAASGRITAATEALQRIARVNGVADYNRVSFEMPPRAAASSPASSPTDAQGSAPRAVMMCDERVPRVLNLWSAPLLSALVGASFFAASSAWWVPEAHTLPVSLHAHAFNPLLDRCTVCCTGLC